MFSGWREKLAYKISRIAEAATTSVRASPAEQNRVISSGDPRPAALPANDICKVGHATLIAGAGQEKPRKCRAGSYR